MEYGLDGEATVYATAEGWAFPGAVDGDWTWGVEVLLDGRAGMTLADKPLRVLNRSIDQRLEAHALLMAVRRWPHLTLKLATEREAAPVLPGAGLPPRIDEASGPADLWWFDRSSAVHLELDTWWAGDRDVWTARCFSKEPATLSRTKEPLLSEAAGMLELGEVWCTLCTRKSVSGRPCS